MYMRPAVKVGLRPLWRDKGTLQLGVDPRRARALRADLGKALGVVSLLDGSRDTDEVARAAKAYGIPEQDSDRVIGLLAAAGLLDDFPTDLGHPEVVARSLHVGRVDVVNVEAGVVLGQRPAQQPLTVKDPARRQVLAPEAANGERPCVRLLVHT